MTRNRVSKLSKRLKRLVKTEICPAEDATKYTKELRELVDQIADKGTVKMESRFFKALANETRIKILKLLSLRRMCVCEIMVALNLTQPTASHHLHIMENIGIVEGEREGKWIFYSITNPNVTKIFEKIEKDVFVGQT